MPARHETALITTRDGACPAHVYRPDVAGTWPAVLVYMDGIGIRPAMLEVGERLATHGHFVLLPDRFYRTGPDETMHAKTVFTDPAPRNELNKHFASATQANLL